MTAEGDRNRVSMGSLGWYYLRLGALGFGGPVALANRMRSDLVETKHWLSESEYNEGLAVATACPGPLAYQLAVYCGYVLKGLAGGLLVAVAFAVAPFCFVVAAAFLYTKFQASAQVHALFRGIGPVVVALVTKASYQLAKKTLTRQWLPLAVAVAACVMTVVIEKELTLTFVVAGMLGMFLLRPKSGRTPSGTEVDAEIGLPPADASTWLKVAAAALLVLAVALALLDLRKLDISLIAKQFIFFFRTGLMIFGSGLVIVPFLKEYVVDQFHWLSQDVFLDAVAVGLITPGPVVITATFVGYVLSGIGGALASTVGIFLPAVLFTAVGTPLLRRYRQNPGLQGFIRGVTTAVVGVLIGTSILLGRSVLHDAFTWIVGLICLVVVFRAPKVPEPLLVLLGAVLGLILETGP
jgi:chromate transporter